MDDRIEAGPADLDVGEVRVVRVPDGKPPYISLLVARSKVGWRAYWNVCRHLPIPLDAGLGTLSDGLVCISHGARYRLEDGVCTEGPCRGESLHPLPVVEIDGRLVIQRAGADGAPDA